MNHPFELRHGDPDYATILEVVAVALDDKGILEQLDISNEEAKRIQNRVAPPEIPVEQMTKKAFIEQSKYTYYGRRSQKIHGVYFDWQCSCESGVGRFCGYRCGMIIEGCTKREAINIAYDLFIKGKTHEGKGYYTQYFIAETDADRRKQPLMADLSPCEILYR